MKTRNLNLMDIREILIQMRAQGSDRQVYHAEGAGKAEIGGHAFCCQIDFGGED